MATPENKPVTVELGLHSTMAKSRVSEVRYSSLGEVARAGLRSFEHQGQALDAELKAKVEVALAETTPPLPQAEVFAALRAHLNERRQS